MPNIPGRASGRIRTVAFAPVGTQFPRANLPSPGGDIDWNDSALADWVRIGAEERGDAGDLAEDNVECKPLRESQKNVSPTAQSPESREVTKNGIEAVDFVAFSDNEDLVSLDSSKVMNENGETWDVMDTTYRAMVIEVRGKRVDYLPRVAVNVDDGPASVKDKATLKFNVEVYGEDSPKFRSGRLKMYFQ